MPLPTVFSLPKRNKIWWCEGGLEEEEGGEGEEEKVHLLTHATARGVGKNSQHSSPKKSLKIPG